LPSRGFARFLVDDDRGEFVRLIADAVRTTPDPRKA
jgi:hypothetical protein